MIEINNLITNSIDEEFLRDIIQQVLIGEGCKKELNLSCALVGQDRIRELNKKYRGKNRATDILAFPNYEVKKVLPQQVLKTEGLGELVVCLQVVRKNAEKFNVSFEKELARILIHGVLHLLEYDHEKSKKEAEEMQKKEEYYLRQLKF